MSGGINYPIKPKLYLNFKISFINGISVPHYVYNDKNIITDSTLDKFDLKRSTTDIVKWDLGILFWPNF